MTTPPPRHRDVRWLVAALVLVAFALRVGFVLTLPPAALYWDEPLYDKWAKLYQGAWPSLFGASTEPTIGEAFRASLQKGELYAAMVGAIYAVAGPQPRAVFLVQAALDSLTCLLLYGLAAAVAGVPAGLAALALAALYEPFIFTATRLQTETVTALLYVAALWALCVPERRRSDGHFVAGFLAALAMLARPALQFFVAALLPMLAVRNSDRPRRERVWLAVAFALGFSFVVAPRLLLTKVVAGEALWSGSLDPSPDLYGGAVVANAGWKTNHVAFAIPPRDELLAVLGGDATRKVTLADYRAATIRTWLHQPLGSAAVAMHKLYEAWLHPYNDSHWTYLCGAAGVEWYHRAMLALGLIGMPLAWQRWRIGAVLIAATLYLWLTYVIVKIEIRYAIVAMPLMLCFAGVAVTTLGRGWRRAWQAGERRRLGVLVTAAVLAVLAAAAATTARLVQILGLSGEAAQGVRVAVLLAAIAAIASAAADLAAAESARTRRLLLLPPAAIAALVLLFGRPLALNSQEWEATLTPHHGIVRQEIVLPADLAPPSEALLKLDLLPGVGGADVVVRLDGQELKRYPGGLRRDDADLPLEGGFQKIADARGRHTAADKAWYTMPVPVDRLAANARLAFDVAVEGREGATGSLTVFGDFASEDGRYVGPSLLAPFSDTDTSLFKYIADDDFRMRRRIELTGSSHSRFHDGTAWSDDDLSPAPGYQQGRYRIFLVLLYDRDIAVL